MRKQIIPVILLFLSLTEIVSLFFFALQDTENRQDMILINEAVQSIQNSWNTLEMYEDKTGLDYVVLNQKGTVVFRTKSGLNESIHSAVLHGDTILDLYTGDLVIGKILLNNRSLLIFQSQKRSLICILSLLIFLQDGLCIGYTFYLNRTIIHPFQKLKGFAERIADGNLDIPLAMDRQNLFGAFTESFDLMRSELKKAQKAEAKANADKKELVAKLSHDIKTPVASIKAASEVGAALTAEERTRENYLRIIQKADQINTLIHNLFSATLEELKQLSVTPEDLESKELNRLLENADYLHRSRIPVIPDCLFYADRLRLQQVLDNLFSNSYKYADTEILLSVSKDKQHLFIQMEDYGGGVPVEELPLLKEKFKRGSHTEHTEGAGLGLYISDHFMKEMQGELILQNGIHGLRVTVVLSLSGFSTADISKTKHDSYLLKNHT